MTREVANDSDFRTALQHAGAKPVVVDFFATWCVFIFFVFLSLCIMFLYVLVGIYIIYNVSCMYVQYIYTVPTTIVTYKDSTRF